MPTKEQLRLQRLIGLQETTIRGAFDTFVADLRSDRSMAQVSDLLENGDIESALRYVDSYVIRLGTVIPKVFQAAADAATVEVARHLGQRAGGAAVSFDPTNARASVLMRANQLDFVKEFSKEQRNATRQALSEFLMEGTGVRGAASAFKDSIGLTSIQERAVRNYGNLLRAGSSEALDRTLRDRRFDGTVERALRNSEPLSGDQVDRMTDRYRSRYVDYRAETIARTEGVRVTSVARAEAVQQTMDSLGLPKSAVRRVWNSTNDKRTRDSHREMDGQEVGEDEPFVSGDGNNLMFPGDPTAPPAETINCRCVITMRIP